MNGSDTFNTAGAGSSVGAQVGHMHNSNIYVVGPDDPPERIYTVGRRYLADGVPRMARDHLERASARGLDDPSLRFHWALAILSKRSYRDLAKKDRAVLAELSTKTEPASDDHWRRGLRVVLALVSCVDGSGGDSDAALTELRSLPSQQRDLVVRHLGLVLTGSMKQGLWNRIRRRAKQEQLDHERVDRVWAYFEPEPARPRARYPAPKSTNGWDLFGGVLLAATTLLPAMLLMRSALAQGSMSALISCLAVMVFGTAASWHIAVWNHKHRRRVAAEREYGYRRSRTSPPKAPPKGGFTDQVDRSFDRYFAKYAPDPGGGGAWPERTKGLRRALRDEVVRIYRETGVEAEELKWLIRFLVRDVRSRWLENRPLEPYELHKLDTASRVRCVFLCLFLLLSAVTASVLAFEQAPVSTVGCLLLSVVAARFSIPLWLKIHSERQRFAEETQEVQDTFDARKAEYERWKTKLETTKPTETEMEAWLDADKTLILDDALKKYGLHWHEVIAHAFLPTPERGARSAHRHLGPWRYSRYEIKVFLVTNEGVREATATLEFERGLWSSNGRINYRFEAISSVQVEITSSRRYELNITLTNGPAKNIVVSESPTRDTVDEEQTEASDINLDAAGFAHTLRILEGIAAEGKPWFDREADPRPPDVSDSPAAA